MSDHGKFLSSPEFLHQLADGLDLLLNKPVLTDVEIICENGTFFSHKIFLAVNSRFFYEIFTKGSTDLNQVDLRIISASTFQIIINFIYTGYMKNIENTTVAEADAIQQALFYLDMKDVISNHIRILMATLSPNTFADLWKRALTYQMKDMGFEIATYVANHLKPCMAVPTFVELLNTQMISLVSIEPQTRSCKNDQLKFQAIKNWAMFDLCNREKYISRLIVLAKFSKSLQNEAHIFFEKAIQKFRETASKQTLRKYRMQISEKQKRTLATAGPKTPEVGTSSGGRQTNTRSSWFVMNAHKTWEVIRKQEEELSQTKIDRPVLEKNKNPSAVQSAAEVGMPKRKTLSHRGSVRPYNIDEDPWRSEISLASLPTAKVNSTGTWVDRRTPGNTDDFKPSSPVLKSTESASRPFSGELASASGSRLPVRQIPTAIATSSFTRDNIRSAGSSPLARKRNSSGLPQTRIPVLATASVAETIASTHTTCSSACSGSRIPVRCNLKSPIRLPDKNPDEQYAECNAEASFVVSLGESVKSVSGGFSSRIPLPFKSAGVHRPVQKSPLKRL